MNIVRGKNIKGANLVNEAQFAKFFPANAYKCSETAEDQATIRFAKIFLAISFVSYSPKFS